MTQEEKPTTDTGNWSYAKLFLDGTELDSMIEIQTIDGYSIQIWTPEDEKEFTTLRSWDDKTHEIIDGGDDNHHGWNILDNDDEVRIVHDDQGLLIKWIDKSKPPQEPNFDPIVHSAIFIPYSRIKWVKW